MQTAIIDLMAKVKQLPCILPNCPILGTTLLSHLRHPNSMCVNITTLISESDEIERVQKRVLRIIFPQLHYRDALTAANLERLGVRRENMMQTTFNEIKSPAHILNPLLTPRSGASNTRSQYPYELPRHRTARFTKSFFSYCIRKRY